MRRQVVQDLLSRKSQHRRNDQVLFCRLPWPEGILWRDELRLPTIKKWLSYVRFGGCIVWFLSLVLCHFMLCCVCVCEKRRRTMKEAFRVIIRQIFVRYRDFQFSIGLILVALKSEMSRCQIANTSNWRSTSKFYVGSRSKSFEARGLLFWSQTLHLCLKRIL